MKALPKKPIEIMTCKYNSFQRKHDGKTAFVLTEGDPIFSETIYKLEPAYIRKRFGPIFTLVHSGRHISGFFEVSKDTFLGDYKRKTLVAFLRGEDRLDLFEIDQDRERVKRELLKGTLNDLLLEARRAVTA